MEMRTQSFRRLIRDRRCIRSMFPRPADNAIVTVRMAKKHGLPSVFSHYMDSIHGFALSKEGLLVAANCQSCHGSHDILSHKDPAEPDVQGEYPQDLRNLPREDKRRLPGRGTRQGRGSRQSESAGLHRLPHGARHSAADGVGVPHAVNADLRLLPQRQAIYLSRHLPLAAWARWAATWRRHAAGTAMERTRFCPHPIRVRRSTRPTWSRPAAAAMPARI